MKNGKSRETHIYRVPPIKIYEVTEDQLMRIEESCRSIGYDSSFCISLGFICALFVIAILSSGASGVVLTF